MNHDYERRTLHNLWPDVLIENRNQATRIRTVERELVVIRKWHSELLDAIYEEMPDGMNERPDPRLLVREWRRAHGELAEAKAEVERLKKTVQELDGEKAWLFKAGNDIGRERDALTQRLAKWRECAESFRSHAWHAPGCGLPATSKCTCNLGLALAAFDKLQKEEPK